MALPQTEYDPLFTAAEETYGLPYGLLKAIAKTESGFNPKAVSPAGAKGLMQFTDGTAKDYGVDQFDPASSIDGAGRYMRRLIDMFSGDVGFALSAYNGGPGTIKRWMETGKPRTKENVEYAPKVFKAMGLDYQEPLSPMVGRGNYSFYSQGKNAVPSIPEVPYTERPTRPSQLNLPTRNRPSLWNSPFLSLDPETASLLGLNNVQDSNLDEGFSVEPDERNALSLLDNAVEPTPDGHTLASILASGIDPHTFYNPDIPRLVR